MSTEKVVAPAPGETLVGIEPELLQRVDPGWRRRLSLYTGRALTQTALTSEQQYRSGRLAILSQSVTPGTAAGLDVAIKDDGTIRVAPGFGFVATGDDVTLPRELVTTADALQVVDVATAVPIKSLGDLKSDAAAPKGGVFVLLLLPVSGKATGAEIDTGAGPVEVTGELSASCRRDPEAYAFEDWEIVDGAQLVLATWPAAPDALKVPDANPAVSWRNRLAYTIFDAELRLGTPLPWQTIGVALGLVAFGADWKMLFFDRNAVVRSGGRSLRRPLGHAGIGAPGDFVPLPQAAAESRLLQLLEQNAQIAAQANFTMYQYLPPTAILPSGAVDLDAKRNRWFPANWTLHGAPIHAEEVETALRAQMFTTPFDLTKAEEADLLLPLTDDVYDPQVLVDETLDPLFAAEKQKAADARDAALRRRKFLQQEANALRRADGQAPVDLDAGLSPEEKAARDSAAYTPPSDGSETFGTVKDGDALMAAEVKTLLDKAAASPFTITAGDKTIPLLTDGDRTALTDKGLQAFADGVNARINKVEDALNLNFLQTQTDIYRYRTNVLKASDATRLVTSPIIANIAERESAVATAQDLNAYITSISGKPAAPPPANVTQPPPAVNPIIRAPLNLRLTPLDVLGPTAVTKATTPVTPIVATRSIGNLGGIGTVGAGAAATAVSFGQPAKAVSFSSAAFTAAVTGSAVATDAALTQIPSKALVPTEGDVTGQLPLEGVPFNLRTLNIAERLKTSPSHEALLYSLSTRTGFLDAVLAGDFGISVDDLEILVQEQDAQDPTKFNLATYSIGTLRTDAAKRSVVFGHIQAAGLPANADESAVFSAGITALEHHTLLLRAVEGRIALYREFLTIAARAQTAVEDQLNSINAALTGADNGLAQARGSLALVTGLMNDELARIQAVNDRRRATRTSAPFVVLMRRGTVPLEAAVPSQQLFPADVASPVPAALQSSAIVPPELRELAAILREAPPAWLPAIEPLLARLERPQQFTDLALHMRVRAFARVQIPPAPSSATTHPGPFGQPIADIFSAHQSTIGALMQQRASFDHTRLAGMSWTAQKDTIFHVAAVNDLIVSDAVHLEIANAITAIVDHVSKVATALYVRACAIVPVRRLAWAEYLRDAGRHVGLRSLTVLPGWNDVDYVERQQMQMLVDWLFTQIDVTLPDAVAYMSDMARTAILLASHAPVDDVIAGEIAARTPVTVGGRVPLTAASPRIARGMPVLLYHAGGLAAHAVVDDLDAQQVSVKVTTVYMQDAVLDQTSHAEFLNDEPRRALTVKAALARR